MKQLLPLLLFFFTFVAFSQTNVDSLQQAFSNAREDTTKIRIMLQLYLQYRYDMPEKAEEVLLKSMELANKINHSSLQVESYNKYAEYLRTQSRNDSAITIYDISIKLAEKANFQEEISDIYNGLGYIYLRKGNYKKALDYHQKNLALSQKLNNNLRMAWSYGAIGSVYNEMGEYTKAMENYVLSSKKHEGLGNLRDYAVNLANIGMLQRKLENVDNAKDYLKKSDSVFELINYQPGRAFVLTNLGIIYKNSGEFELAIAFNKEALNNYELMGNKAQMGAVNYTLGTIYWEQDKFHEALDYFQKRLKSAIEVKDSVGISTAHKAIGDCYQKLNQTNNAKSNYLIALNVANLTDNRIGKMHAHQALSLMYAGEGNFEKAYENNIQYSILRDSLYTKEKRDLASEIEAKYQNEQKTKEIAFLASEKQIQDLQLSKRVNERNAIIAFAIIVLLLAVILYNQYRIKQKRNKDLQELDRLKSNFFANISHEFRTPLTLIKGPIEHLEQNPNEGLTLEIIRMIRRNTNRVLQLVNQLLDLSKIDEGNLQLKPTEGDVYKCLRGVISSFNSHAAQRNIDYKVQIPNRVLWASFDRDKFEKIVYNLLSNAFKFSENGAVVAFSVDYEKDGLGIIVSDTGAGIPAEKHSFIFDRFYQINQDAANEHEGTGIGLSLSKELVDLMDGTITVSSEVGKGTIFTVLLPIQRIKTGDYVNEEISTLVKPEINGTKPYVFEEANANGLPRLLLVEDNPDMSFFIKENLKASYRVQEAKNGKIALEYAKEKSPDLIITDIMMPVMDGVELCKSLKSDLDTSHIPVIMLTAKAGMENKISGLQIGADDYLTKPFESKELLARVGNLIAQRKRLRELYSKKETSIDPMEIAVTSLDQNFLSNLLALLERECANPDFGVPDMQKTLAMSKTQLYRKMKSLTNEAPGELLRNFRLKRAAQLLSSKADNVTQVAYSVGFNDHSYFTKCFKALYQCTPSEFANKM